MSNSSPCNEPSAASTNSESIRVDGYARTFLTHTPEPPSGRLPLVFAFHGRGETPELLEHYSDLDRLRAVVVYPRGLPGRGAQLSWSGTPTAAKGIDDVRFVRAIFARLKLSACIDPARAYATGKSDGGGFAAELACDAADIVRAVAPVAGAYYPIVGGCRPARPVAILEFHGTRDRVIPYLGSPRRKLPNIRVWLAAWAMRDGCAGAAAPSSIGADVTRDVWRGCRDEATVVGYRIFGGGHTWPGARSKSGPGMTIRTIDATALIAHFFAL